MRSWDIFCRIVDNYGDAGVCWRLARQLAAEHGRSGLPDPVRLWIDDLSPLARIWPGVAPDADAQRCAGVDIRRWNGRSPDAGDVPHDVVIEAFACETPPRFVDAMAARHPQPAWFNLEYLSAEAWVEDCHLLPSPHPRLPLIKHFFFPGFTERTGGLLRERDLLAQRDAFRSNDRARYAGWVALGVAPPAPETLAVSLFAYPNAAAAALFAAMAAGPRSVSCVVPESVLRDEITHALGRCPAPRQPLSKGNLTLTVIPFVAQVEYDRLLWSCDFNFVRGEDSFVRAQWAGVPLAWHIYPQQGDAHLPKLRAFVDRYAAALPEPAAGAARGLIETWNRTGDIAAAWAATAAALPEWKAGAARWATSLALQSDLAQRLAECVEKRL